MGKKRRKRKRRGARKTISILVDGETELWYFQMLQKTEGYKGLNIAPELPVHKPLEQQYERFKENVKRYDIAIWLLDSDKLIEDYRSAGHVNTKKQDRLQSYIKYTEENSGAHIFVNTPCLEYWFLLHIANTGRFYEHCSPIIKELRDSDVLTGYKKTEKFYKNPRKNIYETLRPRLRFAKQNAKRLGRFKPYDLQKAKAEIFKIINIVHQVDRQHLKQ